MNQFKLGLLFALLVGLMGLLVLLYTTNSKLPPVVKVIADPLEEAMESVGAIHFDTNAGSFIIVGREDQHDGKYLYHAITCYHVVNKVATKAQEYQDATVAIQIDFHQQPKVIETKLTSINYLVPARDWAMISFILDVKLPCAIFATKEEFNSMARFETIYGVGADDASWLMSRTGTIAATSNVDIFLADSQSENDEPWNALAEIYFHTTQPISRGCSGGGIFRKNGHLIGMYTALTIRSSTGVDSLPHSAVAQKTFEIRKLILKDELVGVKD